MWTSFSKALADNAPGIDAALKSVGELGKQIGPLAARLQTLSDDADRVVQSIDPAEVRAIVDNVQNLSAKGVSVVDRADKLLADNSDSIHSTLQSADVFAKTLADNAPNVDVTLKNLAEISKTVQPVVAQIQTPVRERQSPDRGDRPRQGPRRRRQCADVQPVARGELGQFQESGQRRRRARQSPQRFGQTARCRARRRRPAPEGDRFAKDRQHCRPVNEVVATVRENKPNIDLTLKNFGELSGKLNNSADKVDGVLSSAQSFLGSPSTKGAIDRISEAALSVKKLADDTDARIKDIATGLSRFTNSGLREYESLAVEGRRSSMTLTGWCDRSDRIQARSSSGRGLRCLSITAGNDGAQGGWILGPIEIFRRRRARARSFGLRERTRPDPVRS